MDGLVAMLENDPWFIRNNLFILKKWHPDENLLKEDVSTILIWVKLHGIPVMAFNDDGLSVIPTKLGTPLMLDFYTSDMCMQSWGNLMCACCKVVVHVYEECSKNIGADATKNLKKTSQTPKGILIGQKMGFKPKQVFQPVSKKSTANTSEKNMNKYSESTQEVSKSKPFEVLTLVDNDVNFDDDGNLLFPTGIVESDSEVKVVFDETVNLRILPIGKDESDKSYGTNNLLKQWRDSYSDNHDYDPYDDDIVGQT
uniref:Uncharacterized protein n=1 Tax=Tanacetum cinerariifolium TaxID=118510 RepID=A0A6L2M3T6_TANCI|nr:hypothetical protein [Tanacetum cinerariifolium]